MVKIEVEVPEGQYETLKRIAEKVGLPVERLIQQSIDQDLANADCWLERALMIF